MLDKEKLIEFVQNYPFLYNKHDKRYKDLRKTEIAWKEIGKKLRAPADDCRRTWTLMRDSLRRSIKKQMELDKSNGSESSFKKYKYEDDMEFLLPYLRHRTPLLKNEENSHNYTKDKKDICKASISFVGVQSEEPNEDTQVEETTEEMPVKLSKLKGSPGQNAAGEETPFNTLLKTFMDGKNNCDQIDQFFASIASTVRAFPAEDKIIAKAKVFELITTMELEILNKNNSEQEIIHDH